MPKKGPFSGFGSACIHSRSENNKKSDQNAHCEPIYATSTYTFKSVEESLRVFNKEEEGYIYSRWGNPTIDSTAAKIAALESFGLNTTGGSPINPYCLLFSSGMGAITGLILSNLEKGDKVITQGSLYGGTNELLNNVLPKLGIESIIVDLNDHEEVSRKVKNDPLVKMLYIETPANPTNNCHDLEKLANIAKKNKIISAVDNTYSTPFLQQPFAFGIDFIVHSATKFLNGHGSCIGGALVGKDAKVMKTKVWDIYKLLGANSNAFDAWLIGQGIKTLEIRMQRHSENGKKVAEFLEGHAQVEKVHYPGLPSHPDHELAKKQMRDFGGMLSFEIKGGLDAGISFMNKIRFCTLAVSLGTVDTLIQHPASMTHAGVDKEIRLKYGITDGLIRVSTGIENIEDIIEDLDQALGGK